MDFLLMGVNEHPDLVDLGARQRHPFVTSQLLAKLRGNLRTHTEKSEIFLPLPSTTTFFVCFFIIMKQQSHFHSEIHLTIYKKLNETRLIKNCSNLS